MDGVLAVLLLANGGLISAAVLAVWQLSKATQSVAKTALDKDAAVKAIQAVHNQLTEEVQRIGDKVAGHDMMFNSNKTKTTVPFTRG